MTVIHLYEKLISGSVITKSGYLYWVLNVYENGVRKPKWIATHMKAKGNKKRAKDMLLDVRREWAQKLNGQATEKLQAGQITQIACPERTEDILFIDLLHQWLEYKRSQADGQSFDEKQIDIVTYSSYASNFKNPIEPYFKNKPLTLSGITKDDIKAFYYQQLQRVCVNTVKHYHIIIHGALKYAVNNGLISSNPADNISFPKQKKFKGDFYRLDEAVKLLKIIQHTDMEIPVLFAAFYGMRRSEIIGLKWGAFDFTYNTFTVQHTVTQCNIDGESIIVKKDKTKTQSSLRTYPLDPYIKERLLDIRKKQEFHKQICGRSYINDYLGYICVNEIGDFMKPEYLTRAFSKMLEKQNMRHIRFHDLRHTCAALLMANKVPLERIQEWLGHSEIGTTVDIYGHLEFTTKVDSANMMHETLRLNVYNE